MIYDKDEFHQIQWFGIDEIPSEKSDPHLKRFIKKMKENMSNDEAENSHVDDSELKKKKIVVIPYNIKWSQIFKMESEEIKKALGPNCIA